MMFPFPFFSFLTQVNAKSNILFSISDFYIELVLCLDWKSQNHSLTSNVKYVHGCLSILHYNAFETILQLERLKIQIFFLLIMEKFQN